jgi:serine/threonine protein kinase
MSKADSSSHGKPGEPKEKAAILAEIHVYSVTALIAKYAIEHGEYIIGRDATCHIMVDADAVSRHHARLSFSAFELIIEDLGSSNGVYIEGVQVLIPTRIRPDQELQIGSARLFVRLSADASAQFSAALADKDLGLVPVREMLAGKKYKVITTIGRGGMGVVMQARDVRIRRTVAMKVMKTSHQFSRENVLRFVDEAQLTGQLEHPNIVPVYELGTDESGETFYTMKYVKGITLDAVLRSLRAGRRQTVEKYPLGALLTIFQKICDAVAFAHSKGVVHRDLKPENVMIGAYGEVLVMDWGLAKNLTGAQRGGSKIETTFATEPATDPRGFETMHGLIVGTPPYISPEQARGELDKIDGRSDIYVLGEILYAILTLRPPVVGATVPEIVDAILNSRVTPPTSFNHTAKSSRGVMPPSDEEVIELLHLPGKRVPEGLSALVMKAMHLAPEERYQSVEEMQADVAAYQGGFATKAERAGPRKQILLWAGRHKGEAALIAVGFILFTTLLASFIYRVTTEKNRAQASEVRALENERRARESEHLAAERLKELRGTAPTFFDEAGSLLEERSFVEALDKIDYALEQVPNNSNYHDLRGKVLQSMLRWDEAIGAFEEALRRNPQHASAKLNLDFTRKLNAEVNRAGGMTPAILREFHDGLIRQDRSEEARALLTQIPRDRELFRRTWRAVFEKRGLKERFETNDDETLRVDLSHVLQPDLRKLSDAPVVSLNLDDSKIPDINGLKGLKLESLSLNRTLVFDLSPLAAMPLRSLSIDGTRVNNLAALAHVPLESLHLSGTRVGDLAPLAGKRLEELVAANCKNLKDLSPLQGTPLQRLDISRTAVRDLTPLIGSPLRELNLSGCVDLIDLRPLSEMTQLEAVVIPTQCKDIGYLRDHPSLRRLSYEKMTQPVYEFWQQFDAKPPAAPKP